MIKINKSNSLFQISSDRGVGAKRCEQMTAVGGGRVGVRARCSSSLPPYSFPALLLSAALNYPNAWNRQQK